MSKGRRARSASLVAVMLLVAVDLFTLGGPPASASAPGFLPVPAICDDGVAPPATAPSPDDCAWQNGIEDESDATWNRAVVQTSSPDEVNMSALPTTLTFTSTQLYQFLGFTGSPPEPTSVDRVGNWPATWPNGNVALYYHRAIDSAGSWHQTTFNPANSGITLTRAGTCTFGAASCGYVLDVPSDSFLRNAAAGDVQILVPMGAASLDLSTHGTYLPFVIHQVTPTAAAFSVTPGLDSMSRNFDASASTGSIDTWTWDFGDGNTGTGQTTSHTYTHPGTFTVQLTVHSTDGDTDSTTKQVTIGGLVVNSTGDASDVHPGDGSCDTGGVIAGGAPECTLRGAIEETNASSGAQMITFAIPGAGTPTIAPATALPAVTAATSIDGTTQTGGWVALDGSSAGSTTDGLVLQGAQDLVRGMVVARFGGAGVRLSGHDNDEVRGDRIGTSIDGTTAAPNGVAQVVVDAGTGHMVGGASGTTPGGACTGDCNTIAVAPLGVQLTGTSNHINVLGNQLGLTADGSHLLSATQAGDGIVLAAGTTNQIGASSTAGRNVIAGATNGIRVQATNSGTIEGNFVGTDTTGEVALGNGTGVFLDSGEAVIGGATATPGTGAGNVISGNGAGAGTGGVVSTAGGTVAGNIIGLDATGTAALANRFGVSATKFTRIGTTDGANVISGNTGDGIDVSNDESGAVSIAGNLIGTDVTGLHAVGNGGFGVEAAGAVTVGFPNDGTSTSFDPTVFDPTHGNVIAGNGRAGVKVTDGTDPSQFAQAAVDGNSIGLALDGETALPNQGRGVDISTEATTQSERAALKVAVLTNSVASNTADGIAVSGPDATLGLGEGPTAGTLSIAYNLVGADRILDGARPNQGWGITVGGLADANIFANQVTANDQGGIHVRSTFASLASNHVGSAGALAAGNGGAGIWLQGDGNVVGGPALSLGGSPPLLPINTIEHNHGPGVLVSPTGSTQSVGNAIRGNDFADNTGLPIDLSLTSTGDGTTPNNPSTTGTGSGPNDLLNHPFIDGAVRNGNTAVITGQLQGLGGWGKIGPYAIDVYDAADCHAARPTARYLGTATTDISANGRFTLVLHDASPSLHDLVATATSPSNDLSSTDGTSEMTALDDCGELGRGTWVTQHAGAGQTEVQVNDSSAVDIGDTVIVNPGAPNEERLVVTGKGSLIFNETRFAHEPLEPIIDLTPEPVTTPTSPSPTATPIVPTPIVPTPVAVTPSFTG